MLYLIFLLLIVAKPEEDVLISDILKDLKCDPETIEKYTILVDFIRNISRFPQIQLCPNGGCTDIKIMIGNLIITYNNSNTTNSTNNSTEIDSNTTNNIDSHSENVNNTNHQDSHSETKNKRIITLSALGFPLYIVLGIIVFVIIIFGRKYLRRRRINPD
jgi:hypothetical protein